MGVALDAGDYAAAKTAAAEVAALTADGGAVADALAKVCGTTAISSLRFNWRTHHGQWTCPCDLVHLLFRVIFSNPFAWRQKCLLQVPGWRSAGALARSPD